MKQADKQYSAKKITISDIAEELGCSKTTISRAISGKGRISAEMRQKVQEYIRERDYKPNVIAKGLAQSKTYNIGVILPADANLIEIPFFQCCLMGICEAAAGMDYDVVVATTTEDDISLLKRLINNQKVDGIILTRSLVNDMAVRYLKETGIPVVLVGSNEDDSIIQIDSNHTAGCCELTSILLRSGNQRLALIVGNQNHRVNRNRLEGFMKAHRDLGINADESLIFKDMTNSIQIQRVVGQILDRGADCIICSDDFICSRVLVKLQEMNCAVPDRVRVASFYNSIQLETHNPPITVLSIDVKVLGMSAGKHLIQMISGESVDHKSLINYEIILKRSTS